MKRWLVTCHDQYYPRTGTSDWREVFADEDHQKALDYARWLETEYGDWKTATLKSAAEASNIDIAVLEAAGWDPLADNGDAFRLATNLKINVMFLNWAVKAKLHNSEYETDWIDYGRFNGDAYAATRYAIVVAAAEIARNKMK